MLITEVTAGATVRLTCSDIEMLARITFLDDELACLHSSFIYTVDYFAHLCRVEVLEKIVVHDRVSNDLFRPVTETHGSRGFANLHVCTCYHVASCQRIAIVAASLVTNRKMKSLI